MAFAPKPATNYRIAGIPTSIKGTPNPYSGLASATGIPGVSQAASVARTGAMAKTAMGAPKPLVAPASGVRKIKVKRRPGPFLKAPTPAGGFNPSGSAMTP